ncbi:hypothetical protein BAQ48_02295 [Bacillus luti]|uniref:hypothetical protein n=1 Tax=Bacillus luti TaxID=2026191 RepID=UPI0008FE67AD|nr:hypothetical protein [Bacillus luti]OJE47013.1 hypothetical protein BAQ48_02295 [Bacillus luti]
MDGKLNAAYSTALKELLKKVLKLIAILLIIGFILLFTVSNIKIIFILQGLIYLSVIFTFLILVIIKKVESIVLRSPYSLALMTQK